MRYTCKQGLKKYMAKHLCVSERSYMHKMGPLFAGTVLLAWGKARYWQHVLRVWHFRAAQPLGVINTAVDLSGVVLRRDPPQCSLANVSRYPLVINYL